MCEKKDCIFFYVIDNDIPRCALVIVPPTLLTNFPHQIKTALIRKSIQNIREYRPYSYIFCVTFSVGNSGRPRFFGSENIDVIIFFYCSDNIIFQFFFFSPLRGR